MTAGRKLEQLIRDLRALLGPTQQNAPPAPHLFEFIAAYDSLADAPPGWLAEDERTLLEARETGDTGPEFFAAAERLFQLGYRSQNFDALIADIIGSRVKRRKGKPRKLDDSPLATEMKRRMVAEALAMIQQQENCGTDEAQAILGQALLVSSRTLERHLSDSRATR